MSLIGSSSSNKNYTTNTNTQQNTNSQGNTAPVFTMPDTGSISTGKKSTNNIDKSMSFSIVQTDLDSVAKSMKLAGDAVASNSAMVSQGFDFAGDLAGTAMAANSSAFDRLVSHASGLQNSMANAINSNLKESLSFASDAQKADGGATRELLSVIGWAVVGVVAMLALGRAKR